eukprot:246508-Pleurochrysis_carterae.AAC.1
MKLHVVGIIMHGKPDVVNPLRVAASDLNCECLLRALKHHYAEERHPAQAACADLHMSLH